MRHNILILTALLSLVVACTPANLEREYAKDAKSLADCVFPRLADYGRWVRQDLYSEGRVELQAENDHGPAITIYAAGSRSRVVAKFPVKATTDDSLVVEEILNACGADGAI